MLEPVVPFEPFVPVVPVGQIEPVAIEAAGLILFTIWNDKETSSKHAGIYSVVGIWNDSSLSAIKYVWSHIID